MRRSIILFTLLVTLSAIAKADSKETVTINGTAANKNITHISFSGDNITLTYSDGATQTADMPMVTIDFDHVAVFKDKDYDNVETIKTYGGKTLKAEVSRTLTAGEWATICLPFSMSATDIAASFGSGTLVATLESATGDGINFTRVEKISSGMPYLIKTTKNVSSFTLNSVEIGNLSTSYSAEGKEFSFAGSLNTVSKGKNMYYIASGNQFRYLTVGEIQPLHAYFTDLVGSSKGDANGDQRVNVADVMSAVSHSLGKTPSIFNFANADVNKDNIVNVTDVMSIIQIVLNGGATRTDIPITLDGEAIGISDGGEGNSYDQAANQSQIEQILL